MLIRNATREDIKTYYGELPPHKVKALVAEDNGEILGIAGIHYAQTPEVFSNISEQLQERPILLYKTALKIVSMARGLGAIATADDDQESAERFLTRLGFVRDGKVWRI